MKNRTVLMVLVLVGLHSGLVAATAAGTEGALPLPSATVTRDGSVAEETALALAGMVAAGIWQTAEAGPAIPCTDLDGELVCYMVPFRTDGQPFPPLETVFADVAEDNRMRARMGDAFVPPYAMAAGNNQPAAASTDMLPRGDTELGSPVPPLRPDGQISHRLQYERARREHHEDISALAKTESYGTVVVSARRDRHPLMAIYHFLPPFFTTGPRAEETAGETAGAGHAQLRNLVFLDPAHLYFSFDCEGETVLVHGKTLETVDHDDPGLRNLNERLNRPAVGESAAIAGGDGRSLPVIWDELLGQALNNGEER